ncbi:MAG: hypothetical protein KC416_15275, partial [Myxococcales bacterium]|nr:hypothetical protein [Myxococcales bacterium]
GANAAVSVGALSAEASAGVPLALAPRWLLLPSVGFRLDVMSTEFSSTAAGVSPVDANYVEPVILARVAVVYRVPVTRQTSFFGRAGIGGGVHLSRSEYVLEGTGGTTAVAESGRVSGQIDLGLGMEWTL